VRQRAARKSVGGAGSSVANPTQTLKVGEGDAAAHSASTGAWWMVLTVCAWCFGGGDHNTAAPLLVGKENDGGGERVRMLLPLHTREGEWGWPGLKARHDQRPLRWGGQWRRDACPSGDRVTVLNAHASGPLSC
jgi:hypothetical protein